MQHLLKNVAARLEIVFAAGYADGDVTFTAGDADGTTVVDAETATKDNDNEGRYTFLLDPQPNVAELTITWSGTWDEIDQSMQEQVAIVGAYLFTIADLRAFKDEQLKSPSAYSDEVLADARARVTDMFQRVCDVSFVPRYGRAVLDGNWRRAIWLPNRKVTRILKVVVNGQALDDDQVAKLGVYPSGKVDRTALMGSFWPAWRDDNVIISYEHGWQFPPAEIARAGMHLARWELVNTDVNERMMSLSNDLGTVRLSIPSYDYPTGIPIVDSTLCRYDERSPVEAY